MFLNEKKLRRIIREEILKEKTNRKKNKPTKPKYETLTIVCVYKDYKYYDHYVSDMSSQKKIWYTIVEYPDGRRESRTGKVGEVGDTFKTRVYR